MKRFFSAVLAFILIVTLCGCTAFQTVLEEQLEPVNTVVFLQSASLPEFSDIDTSIPENDDAELQYRFLSADTPAAQYDAFTTAAACSDTAVLVAELSSTVYAAAMIETAKKYDLPLIFCGKRPSLDTMESYDNCWYVGFDPALAAELQAKIIVDAYRSDIVTDQSGDFKLSALVTGTRRALSFHTDRYDEQLLHTVELAGIHSAPSADPVTAADGNTLLAGLEALLLPQKQTAVTEDSVEGTEPVLTTLAPVTHTELIFCADTAASSAVLQLLSALESAAKDEVLSVVATPARRYFAACYGLTPAVEQAVDAGILLGAVGKDATACTQAILTLCEPLAKKEAITKNNNYYFEDGKYLMLEYRVITAPTEAVQ